MLRRWFLRQTEAQIAGRKAGKAWKNILAHSRLGLEDFVTGKDAYTHACDESRQWIESYFRAQNITVPGLIKLSKSNQHEMHLEYVEAFLKEFAPELETRGQPKE